MKELSERIKKELNNQDRDKEITEFIQKVHEFADKLKTISNAFIESDVETLESEEYTLKRLHSFL